MAYGLKASSCHPLIYIVQIKLPVTLHVKHNHLHTCIFKVKYIQLIFSSSFCDRFVAQYSVILFNYTGFGTKRCRKTYKMKLIDTIIPFDVISSYLNATRNQCLLLRNLGADKVASPK